MPATVGLDAFHDTFVVAPLKLVHGVRVLTLASAPSTTPSSWPH